MNEKITSETLKTNPVEASNRKAPFLLKLGHELKTPIHGVNGISSYLKDNWDNLSDETRYKSIIAICDASENLAKLIDTLINKASNYKQLDFNVKETDLVKITEAVIETCKNLYVGEKDIKIKLNTQKSPITSVVDPFWFSQLLTNLISNSINYSTKGTITVGLSTEEVNDIEYCTVSICDEGIGIKKEDLDSIFIPFNRGSKENTYHQGIGLGLAICREIVEAHGGTISAFNNPKIGSTIKFSIPTKI
jgi:two-component system sensor histidine kinase KdpD